jgi:SAM-dependent methyltransferase
MFSDCFDDWTEHEFKQHIYNDLYIAVDPDYAEIRPKATARLVEQLFQKDKSRIRLLDFGGGNGVCGQLLRGLGFLSADVYDPFTPIYALRPEGKFDVVICFETLEHLPNPRVGIASIIESTSDSGIVLFSTLIQPKDFEKQGMNWWYIGPRNGHISIFSRKSLALAWQNFGFKVASFNENLHFAFRKIPDFAKHFMKENTAGG